MSRYAWIITHDILYASDPAGWDELKIGSEVGTAGPSTATDEEIDKARGNGTWFQMFDDDGEHYYTGRIWHTDGEGACDFQPLDDFGKGNAGCTTIKYKNAAGKWQAI